MRFIPENKVYATILGIGVFAGSLLGIIEGIEKLDAIVCTEAEAQDMIQEQAVPIQRQNFEFQIQQMEYEQDILKRKAEWDKEEPWEEELIKDLEKDIDLLKKKKDALPN